MPKFERYLRCERTTPGRLSFLSLSRAGPAQWFEIAGEWVKKADIFGLSLHFWPRKSILRAIETPRAIRYFLPGYGWHITHRCHKREFLLKFGRDQRRWSQWLFEARKRFGVLILNCAVTSNHIQLILKGIEGKEAISQTMPLVARRTGQEFNRRKRR